MHILYWLLVPTEKPLYLLGFLSEISGLKNYSAYRRIQIYCIIVNLGHRHIQLSFILVQANDAKQNH